MGFWSNLGSWVGENIIGIGQGVANAQLTNRQLAETELNNQFNRDLASKNYEENIKNNEFNRNLASANMEETLKNNAFNRDLASENMAESKLNNQFNRDMAQKTYDFQKEQYENGVLNQAKQYEALGISPSAILGGLSNMPSMSNSQASSSGFSGASTSGFSGANVGSSYVQANVNSSNLQYNLGLTSSLLDIKRKKAEIDNINSQTDSNSARVNLISSETEYNSLLSDYQKLLNSDKSDTKKMLSNIGLTEGLIRDLQNVDWQTALALGVVKLVDIANDVKSNDVSASDSDSKWVNSLRDNWYSLNTCNSSVKSAISDFGKNIGFDSELSSEDWYNLSNCKSYNDAYSYLSNLYNPVKTSTHKSSSGFIHGGKGGSF